MLNLQNLHASYGQAKAIEAIEQSEKVARRVVQMPFPLIPQDTAFIRTYIVDDLADALSYKVYIYRNAGRLVEAEQALREYLRFSREINLAAHHKANLYESAASLRQAQRDFVQAEKLATRSLDFYLQTGREIGRAHV